MKNCAKKSNHGLKTTPPNQSHKNASDRTEPSASSSQTGVPGQKAKASALLIAGVRDNELSRRVAGAQGTEMADRFSAVTPEFGPCIKARDIDVRKLLKENYRRFSQVVAVGVGLDVKPVEFGSAAQRWYGLDLKESLVFRREKFAQAGIAEGSFVAVPADMRLRGWEHDLIQAGFDGTKPTLFIVEGLSMYLELADIRRLLIRVGQLTQHRLSMLWMDHFSEEFFTLEEASVKGFRELIARLGEPFVTGITSVRWVEETGWSQVQTVRANERVSSAAPALHEYLFSTLRVSPMTTLLS